MRRWLATALGAALMIGSVYGFVRFAESAETQAATAETVMPARLIAGGETIDAGMLRTVRVAKAAIPEDAITDASRIIGRTALIPIGPNEMFLSWKLADRQLTPREGERYISFPASDVANVGNMLRRGDRVDIWVELEEPVSLGGKLFGAVKVAEQVLVASVRTAEGEEVTDVRAYDAAFQSAAQQLERTRRNASGKAAINTFVMDEEIYQAYVLAALKGKIKLALPEPAVLPAEPPLPRVSDDFKMLREQLALREGDL